MSQTVLAQSGDNISSMAQPDVREQVLDRVVAVVNNQVILRSDLDLEMQIFRLLPIGDAEDYQAPKALERLITRALIEQQILLEDPHGLEIAPKELDDSLNELRQSLPACKQRDCVSAEGWLTYLKTLDLTAGRVQNYWADRMAILKFIEQRFRSGIRITPEEIRKYYQEDLLPRYAKREDAPKLDRLSERIQEILLQQRVNALMNDWLKSLQTQGQVEVLDAALRTDLTGAAASEHKGAMASPSALPGPADSPDSSGSLAPAMPRQTPPLTGLPALSAPPAYSTAPVPPPGQRGQR